VLKSSTKSLKNKHTLDFFLDICHHIKAMQKIEKWRIREMEHMLTRISHLLRLGDNLEWANVFSHFAQEAHHIAENERFNLDLLKKLTQNILNCFDGFSSLRNLVLVQENSQKIESLNQEFRETIRRFFEILAAIEEKGTESIN
jgi:hypothetical protein